MFPRQRLGFTSARGRRGRRRWPGLARRREGEHGWVNHLVDGVERLMPKLPELAEFVRTIPDLAPSQCFSPLQRSGSRSTSSIRSWPGERTTRTAEVRGVEASDDSSAGSKALAKFVRKRTIQPPAPSASAISTFAAQNGLWRLAWPGEEAVGLLPPDDLFQEDPG